ncbi:MAG: hypothetical protein Q9163_004338 [Psora crenata]
MTKRKEFEEDQREDSSSAENSSEESSSEDDKDMNTLDVEFEWFDPQPEHDFHGIKTLLRQLFDADAQLFDLSALTDLILAQPLLGSTVKVEGNETDPYAFLTVLNLKEHMARTLSVPVISALFEYLYDRLRLNERTAKIGSLMREPEHVCVGLILTERLVNVPQEVVPPMYNMLLEEISWALEEKEPYKFTHYLILSKTYREVASTLDNEESGGTRKHKKQKKALANKGQEEIFYFHAEDEVLHQYADTYGNFEYNKEGGQSDSKRAFQELGIKPQGHVILLEASQFESAVKGLQEYYRQS